MKSPLVPLLLQGRLLPGSKVLTSTKVEALEETFCVIYHPHRDPETLTKSQFLGWPYFGLAGRVTEKLHRRYRYFGIVRHEFDPVAQCHYFSLANEGGTRWRI